MIKRMLVLLGLVLAVLFIAWRKPFLVEPPTASRFVKIDRNGKPLSPWAGPWQCVCDQQTGLLWEVKNDDEGIHDGYWTYSWYDGEKGVENSGDCYFEKDRCDSADLIRRANIEQTCSADNWRLPNVKELNSLVYQDTKPGQPKIDKNFFPQTKHGDYWTSEAEQPLSGVFKFLYKGATAVSFIEGKEIQLPYRNAAFVRLVTTDSSLCHLKTPH